jgi:hypothetical protein
MFYNTQDNMPYKNRLILGTSSFWIINLIYKTYIYELYFQSLLLTSIVIISPLFWYHYQINSIYHKFDNYLSILMLILVLINNYSSISYFDLFIMIKFYYMSLIFTHTKNYNIQLCCHLLFRLFFYKILYLTIDDKSYDINYDIIKYISNNLFIFTITNNNKYCYMKYIIYSCQTIFVIQFI